MKPQDNHIMWKHNKTINVDLDTGEQLQKWVHGTYILIKTNKKITYNANKTIGYIQYTREWRKHPQIELFNN